VTFDITDLRSKADGGSPVAQTALGICFLDGIDVEVNYQEAFRLLSAASKQGTSRSVVNLARMYEEGLGVEKDMAEAIRLYKAVAKVEFFAQIALGRIYSSGKSVVADRNEALRSTH
jgi:TPR repeat protein